MTTDIRSELARYTRVLSRLGLLDAFGHLSVREPGSGVVVATPGWNERMPPGPTMPSTAVLTLSMEGEVLAGSGSPSPMVKVDLELYHSRPDIGAVGLFSPPLTCSFGVTRQPMKPLLHTWGELAEGIAIYESDGLPLQVDSLRDLVGVARSAQAIQLPGVGVFAFGSDLVDLATKIYYLEYSLARSNFIALALKAERLRTLSADELARIVPQRGGPEHHQNFFRSLDPGPASDAPSLASSEDEEEEIRRKMAVACRMLASRGTLVAFLEHVSHRLPGQRWLMTPIKNFAFMNAEDMIVLDHRDRWLGGPRPARFVHFHGDVLRMRSDVNAIVHVHDLFGRVFVQCGYTVGPVWRNGAAEVLKPLPIFPQPDLLFDPEPRSRAVSTLAQHDIVHELAHGTDYVGPTIEEVTVRAIHREELLRIFFLASLIGVPRDLPEGTVVDLVERGPKFDFWWRFYQACLTVHGSGLASQFLPI